MDGNRETLGPMSLRSTEPPINQETQGEWQPPEGFYAAYCKFYADSMVQAEDTLPPDAFTLIKKNMHLIGPKPEAEILAMLRKVPEADRTSAVRRIMEGWAMTQLTDVTGKISKSVLKINERLRRESGM